ncbi:MAG: hypothetical protein ACREP8_01015, partial [Candidatus Binatia bacterium]
VTDVALAPMLNLIRSRANPAGLAIRPMPGFPSEMDALWKQGRSRFRFCVARTADYLRWRFQAVPTRQYRIWGAYTEGGLVAYIVVRIREIRQRPGLRVGVIADLFGRTDGMGRSGAKLLVAAALQWLSTEGADGCMAQIVSPVLRPALWSNGFFRLPKIFSAERQLLIRYPGAAQAAAPDGLGLHFVGGDHDMG